MRERNIHLNVEDSYGKTKEKNPHLQQIFFLILSARNITKLITESVLIKNMENSLIQR